MFISNQANFGVSCIIPFYNEGKRVFGALDALTQSRRISQVICVDDGSEDDMHKQILEKYARVEVVRANRNEGKTNAIVKGLAHARKDNILLFDADLQDVNVNQLDEAIDMFTSTSWADMIILRRINDLLLCRVLRMDIVISGERLLRKNDLKQVLETGPRGYQLELAINHYMVTQGKRVFWMPLYSRHSLKIEKHGLISGSIKESRMNLELFRFKNPFWYFWILLTFCWGEFRHEKVMAWAPH